MSDEISLPLDRMRQIAQQVINDSSNLTSETSSRLQQMRNSNGSLPGSMQGIFSNLLDPLQSNIAQILSLRHSIGQTLSQAANAAESTDSGIASSLTGQ